MDRAFITGLKERWCPDAELVEGRFRGSTGVSLRREARNISLEFNAKSVDVMVFLTDSDDEPWREVQRQERARFPAEHLYQAIHGVPDRNIECWLSADRNWLAGQLGVDSSEFDCKDPKSAFHRAMGIDRDDRKEPEIVTLVQTAPLANWLRNRSFEDFYDQVWEISKRLGCALENLR